MSQETSIYLTNIIIVTILAALITQHWLTQARSRTLRPWMVAAWVMLAADILFVLRPELPATLEKPFFRLAKDYLTRFEYPHMRPDLKPAGFDVEQLWGFHGQHKDAIADYPDAAACERLMRAFTPKQDDVFIDCGAFLGFGDIRMALDAASARPQSAPRWSHIALFNPRRGSLHRAEVDALLLLLSGGKPRADVFAELIAFAESNEPAMEQRF